MNDRLMAGRFGSQTMRQSFQEGAFSMTSFLNPYQFVPVSGDVDGLSKADFKSLADVSTTHPLTAQNRHLSHDRYGSSSGEQALFSGRLICSLKAVGPFVVGHGAGRERETKDEASIVRPYERQAGEPAVPASSLRGLFSSMIEALSNSTLRVLEHASPCSST